MNLKPWLEDKKDLFMYLIVYLMKSIKKNLSSLLDIRNYIYVLIVVLIFIVVENLGRIFWIGTLLIILSSIWKIHGSGSHIAWKRKREGSLAGRTSLRFKKDEIKKD